MRLLIVAAERMEFAGLLRHVSEPAPGGIAGGWSRRAALGKHQLLLTANGAGWDRAAAAVDAAVPEFRPDAVMSMGFCGGLDPILPILGVVVGTAIVGREGACVTSGLPEAPRGPICSVHQVARSRADKKRLRASGGIAVEMEAGGVARRAAALRLPFYIIKAVTDGAEETMENDFNAALRSDGHFDTMKVLAGAMRHPTVRLPELIRLRNRCVRAARVLGDFIADCRF